MPHLGSNTGQFYLFDEVALPTFSTTLAAWWDASVGSLSVTSGVGVGVETRGRPCDERMIIFSVARKGSFWAIREAMTLG